MSASVMQAQELPYWMLIFSFVASSFLTLFAIIEICCRAFRKAKLEIALTREVFFRVLESGESLYANAVLVAYDSGALIQDITVSLTMINGATKTFGMRVAQIGEKFRDSTGVYQFSFHSTSPVSFVPPSNPQRQVFICEHENYSEDTRQCFQCFQQTLFQIKEQFSSLDNSDQNVGAQIAAQVAAAVDEAVTGIMDKVQIEPGKYSLSTTISYRQPGKFFPFVFHRSATSKVEFSVKGHAREYLRHSLREYLQGRARQVLLDQQIVLPAPQYEPSDIREETK